MRNEVFLDAAYAIAVSSKADVLHERAVELAGELRTNRTRMLTTRAVLLEIGNALSKQRLRPMAVGLLAAIEADPLVEIVPFSESLYERALGLFRRRMDKEWGLTDCMSFMVMQERGVDEALTPDVHFEQAGFKALMR